MKWFQIGIRSGSPIEFSSHQLTLRTLVIQLQVPWRGGKTGLLYNRPIAVQTKTGDQAARTLPVINVNRLAIIYTFGWALLAARNLWRINHD